MFQRGLKGVTAVETELSYIDGEKGVLAYRGLPIEQFVNHYSFEETAYYLLYGRFPTKREHITFDKDLKEKRFIPQHTKQMIDSMPHTMPIMDVLRTAVSSLSNTDMDHLNLAQKLIAIIPTIMTYWYRRKNGKHVVGPDKNLNHVENLLYMLHSHVNKTHLKMLEAYMILTMEHGLNASTFAARVTISTKSDLISAITSALGTMKGPLHGGAPSGVIQLLEEINTEDKISKIIHKKLENKERIMGFGHRVYKTIDPRAEALKAKVLEMDDPPNWMSLALRTEKDTINILKTNKPDLNLYTNVEYYAAAIMKTLDIDEELFTPIFSSSRIIGWCAHVIEQTNNNTIFRPKAKYIGQ